eukprot:SAG31_NODE_2895_length_4940_cov_4.688494_6_plen_101_part_00
MLCFSQACELPGCVSGFYAVTQSVAADIPTGENGEPSTPVGTLRCLNLAGGLPDDGTKVQLWSNPEVSFLSVVVVVVVVAVARRRRVMILCHEDHCSCLN